MKIKVLLLIVALLPLINCSGSSSSFSGSSSSSSNNKISFGANLKMLASVTPATADKSFLTLEQGMIYYIDPGPSTDLVSVKSVPSGGGDIITHFTWGANRLFHANGQLYVFDLSGGGWLYSGPDTAVGITTLTNSSYPIDIVSDGNMVYWSEYGKVMRIPLFPSTDSLSRFGLSGEQIFTASNPANIVKIVLDGNILFVSEGQPGNIFSINLVNGTTQKLASGINAAQIKSLPFDPTLPLAVTQYYLYTLVNEHDIVQIDKNTGATSTIISTFQAEGRIRADKEGVYWWLAHYPGITLMRIDSLTGSVSTVMQAPSEIQYTSDVADFISDGNNIWWVNMVLTQQGQWMLEIQYVPVNGNGNATLINTLNANLGNGSDLQPRYLTGDSNNLYWIAAFNRIVKISKLGGSPTTLAQNVSSVLNGFYATDTNLIWGETDRGLVRTMPKAGQTFPTTLWASPNPPPSPMTYQAKDAIFDGNSLYWMIENYDTSTALETNEIFTLPITGGSVSSLGTYFSNTVGTYPSSGQKLFTADAYLFASAWTPNGHTLSIISKNDGKSVDIMTGNLSDPADIYLNNNVAYIALEGYIYTYNILNGQVDKFNFNNFPFINPNKIYVDSSHLYWTEANSNSGGVYRVSLADGTIEVGYQGGPSYQITGDTNYIYFISGWNIYRIPK